MLSVIQGLFKVVRLVTLGFSSLQVKSRALPKMSVNSENLFVISWPEGKVLEGGGRPSAWDAGPGGKQRQGPLLPGPCWFWQIL